MSTPTIDDLPYLDTLDPHFTTDSGAVRAARAARPLARTPTGLAVLSYHACSRVLRERHTVRGITTTLTRQGITEGPFAAWMHGFLLELEGEPHRRQRRLVGAAFTPGHVETLRPAMTRAAEGLADRIADRGHCEAMAEIADPYPARVLAAMLGIQDDEFDRFAGLATDIGLGFAPDAPRYRDRLDAAATGLAAVGQSLVDRRRRHPTGDLITALIHATDPDPDPDLGNGAPTPRKHLSDAELRSLVTGLVFAGQDTTRNQIGRALHAFTQHPDQWDRLTDPVGAERATAEALRLYPSTPATGRHTTTDLTIEGIEVPAGTHLTVLLGAANRDPAVFGPDADTFDIRAQRPATLAFGAGAHFCLGSVLARTEVPVLLRALAGRLDPPRLDGPAPQRPHLAVTGPLQLPLCFTPRASTRGGHPPTHTRKDRR